MNIKNEIKLFEKHAQKFFTTNEAFAKEGDNYIYDEVKFMWDCWITAKQQAVPEGFVLIKASDRDQEMLELIDQRDHMESQAEKLKDKLQALYGVDFGEHSSCNFPFQNAIDYDDSDLVLVKREKLAMIFETATNALVYHTAPPKHDALSIIQGIARKAMIQEAQK